MIHESFDQIMIVNNNRNQATIHPESFQNGEDIDNIQFNEKIVPNDLAIDLFLKCNQGVAKGFGAMFFNIRDPTFTKTNAPVKTESEVHVASIVMTGILGFGVIVFMVLILVRALPIAAGLGIIGALYVLYVILVICLSKIRPYLANMKPYSQYQNVYDQMVKGQGYFTFWIECYHMQTYRTKKGQTRRRKVVTHTASQIFRPTATQDDSGQLTSIADVKDYIFLHYLKRYYFTDDQSQNNFQRAFNAFVRKNTRDKMQNYNHNFQITGFEEFAAFTPTGEGKRAHIFFYIFTFFGLNLLYSCIIEKYVARYEVGILKKLTV